MNTYRTLFTPGEESLYTEKRSRFIGQAFPATSPEEAIAVVEDVRKKYNDARHVCWAWRLGTDDVAVERSSDDGEPSGSAGKPILGRLISHDVRNVVLTVVRYFGGVKLGTGGLAVAYRTTADEALEKSDVREVILYEHYALAFPFELINPVMMLLRETGAEVTKSDADVHGHLYEVRVAREGKSYFEESAGRLYLLTLKKTEE